MSYDFEIFDGDPEAPESEFRALDCRLAWHTVTELLSHERTEHDQDEMLWYLPNLTVSFYLGEKDENVHSMAATIVFGDLPPKDAEPSVHQSAESATRKDMARVMIVLRTLAEKLGAQVYDPQDERFVEDVSAAHFADNLANKDGLQEEYNFSPQNDLFLARTAREQQNSSQPKAFGIKPAAIIAVVLLLGFIGLKVVNRIDRQDAREEEMHQAQLQALAQVQNAARTPVATAKKADVIPSAEIWVDENFTFHRSALKSDEQVRMLTWVIQVDGQTVLERAAENETQYRYFNMNAGSTVTAYLKAHVNGSYHTVSNVVSFRVPEAK